MMLLDEFLAAIQDKSPPASSALLEDFETELGQRLPEDYREFLLRCNGGFADGAVWFRGATLEGVFIDAGVHHVGGLREEKHLSLQAAREKDQVNHPHLANSLLWIMDDPFDNAICLGIEGEYRGRIYFWDHENEPDPTAWDGSVETASNITLLANSFTEFLAGLRLAEMEEDDTFRYVNTDLDLTSTADLTALAAAFEARGLCPLHVTHGDNGLWYATFETEAQYVEPEFSIANMLTVIESLENSLRDVWSGCLKREFNIGYECGSEPWAFNQGLSNELLVRIATAGTSLRLTLYPLVNKKHPDPGAPADQPGE